MLHMDTKYILFEYFDTSGSSAWAQGTNHVMLEASCSRLHKTKT